VNKIGFQEREVAPHAAANNLAHSIDNSGNGRKLSKLVKIIYLKLTTLLEAQKPTASKKLQKISKSQDRRKLPSKAKNAE
jgi:hypothetical protein